MSEVRRERMQCMDIWGGNQFSNSAFALPGLDVWVYSKPAGESAHGGDVYFLSSCASGRITRILTADVSGHGAGVSPIAVRLREMMRRNINRIDQSRLVEALNVEFSRVVGAGGFATAIVGTFFAPTSSLTMHNAGHPYPLIWRQAAGEWAACVNDSVDDDPQDFPLGVDEETSFGPIKTKLRIGDMALFYTDAISESRDEYGDPLLTEGLRQNLNALGTLPAEEIIPALIGRLEQTASDNLDADDATMILMRANGRHVGLKDNLLAPFRLLRAMTGLDRTTTD